MHGGNCVVPWKGAVRMVERYSMGYSMGLNGPERLLTMLNIRDGDYVRYSDYAKLEEALRGMMEATEAVDEWGGE